MLQGRPRTLRRMAEKPQTLRQEWRDAIRDDEHLPPMARLVALCLDRHMRADGSTTYGIAPTAKAAGVSKETAARWLKSLEAWGWLDVTRRKRGAYWTYRARIPAPGERGAPERSKRTDTPIRGNQSVLSDRTPSQAPTVLSDRTVTPDETPVRPSYMTRPSVLYDAVECPTGQDVARRARSPKGRPDAPPPTAPVPVRPEGSNGEALSHGGASRGAHPDGRAPTGDEEVDAILSAARAWPSDDDEPLPELGRRLISEHERSGVTGRKLLRVVALRWRSDHAYGRTAEPPHNLALQALSDYEQEAAR